MRASAAARSHAQRKEPSARVLPAPISKIADHCASWYAMATTLVPDPITDPYRTLTASPADRAGRSSGSSFTVGAWPGNPIDRGADSVHPMVAGPAVDPAPVVADLHAPPHMVNGRHQMQVH